MYFAVEVFSPLGDMAVYQRVEIEVTIALFGLYRYFNNMVNSIVGYPVCCYEHTLTVLSLMIRYPVVSMGVLLWVEHTLTDTTFFEVAAESSPLYLALLDEVRGHSW